MSERFEVREVFNLKVVQEQAQRFLKAWPLFDAQGFVESVTPQLPPLGFKERAEVIVRGLEAYLPGDFLQALDILVAALPPKIEGENLEGYGGFICWPLGDWIAQHGQDHFEASMQALYRLTQSFSAEGAIRPFLTQQPEATLKILTQWAQDPNPHVRRLVSEGTRPRLPWTPALPQYKKDPRPLFSLLEALKEDPALLVRRSVANHLNDVSKDHPDLAVELLSRWHQQGPSERVRWITGHALRTLIKKGHPGALGLMGFEAQPQVSLDWLQRPEDLKIGEEMRFSFRLKSKAKTQQKLVIDFAVGFCKAKGQLADKMFKLAVRDLEPGASVELSKGLVLAQRSTRKLYPGAHRLSVWVGGQEVGTCSFNLEA
ncbi:MAG: DNA alkylation repair protein [bacterium]|nr:DNA alkylation repair protein [bacterium]